MEFALFGVIGVVTIVTVAAFSTKLGVAAPLILVLVGIGYSYIPGVPAIIVEPEWILLGLLPPLLYSAAITVPIVDFRRNFSSIAGLSVVLVAASAFATGFVLFMILPDLSLGYAVALGAVIAPTDVVAATSMGKRLGLPPRLVAILEGEGLVNDATALVLLRSAVAAGALSTTQEFRLWTAVGDFAFAVIAAIAIGLAVGFVTVLIRSKLRDPVLDTAISFAVPFMAFIPAEQVHASGVVAVVVAGLYSGHNGARHFTAQARISQRVNWRTLQFMLENGVFLLMGVQIRAIVAEVHADELSADTAVILGLLVTAMLIVIRFLFVGPLLLVLRRSNEQAERVHLRFGEALERMRASVSEDAREQRRRARAQKLYERRANDLAQLRAEGLGWRGGLVLSWAGMRGVVTLAAAQSLPSDTPYRSQLVLIAFTVAIVTLLVQGGTLPWLIRLSGIPGTDAAAESRRLATLLDEINEAGLAILANPRPSLPGGVPVDEAVLDRVRQDTLLSAASAWERAERGPAPSPHEQYGALRREVLAAEREALLEARSRGSYPSRILTRAQAMLDLEESRLEQADGHSAH